MFKLNRLQTEKEQKYQRNSISKDLKMYISIIKDSWMYQLSIFLTFVVTLSVFPAVTALIQPIQKGKKIRTIQLFKNAAYNSQYNRFHNICFKVSQILCEIFNYRWDKDKLGRNLFYSSMLFCSFQFWRLHWKRNGNQTEMAEAK